MRRTVMVALDGSDKDGRGIAVATAIARLSEGNLHLVRVVGDAPNDLAGVPVSRGLSAAAETERGTAQAQLADLAANLTVPGGHAASIAVLQSRNVAADLIAHAVEQDALLIVLATSAPGRRSRAIVGSVADHVMRESPRPVVLVPPGAAFMAGKTPTIARVLVPMDDSSLSLRSLEFIIELPHAADVEYVLLEVVGEERLLASADTRLSNTATWLRSRGARTVETRAVHASDPAGAIVRSVRDALPDAIVMSTRGAGGLGRLLLGSVAEGVVRQSELPVMLLTPRVLAGE